MTRRFERLFEHRCDWLIQCHATAHVLALLKKEGHGAIDTKAIWWTFVLLQTIARYFSDLAFGQALTAWRTRKAKCTAWMEQCADNAAQGEKEMDVQSMLKDTLERFEEGCFLTQEGAPVAREVQRFFTTARYFVQETRRSLGETIAPSVPFDQVQAAYRRLVTALRESGHVAAPSLLAMLP